MSNDLQIAEPTPLEEEILRAIFDFFQNNYRYPNNRELKAQIEAGDSRIITQQQLTNYKKRLLTKRWIDIRGRQRNTKTFQLTGRGKALLKAKTGTQPAALPLIGLVIAGRSDPGDLIVEETIPGRYPTIPIPDLDVERQTFVLEVSGASMVDSGINEGDYIIVEECQDDEIDSGDLIVAKYLAIKHNFLDEEQLQSQINDPEQYSSHYTVKYCYIIPDPQKRIYKYQGLTYIRRVYRLQQRRVKLLGGEVDKKSTILTSHIRPLGKVIGVYKSFHKSTSPPKLKREI